MSDRPYGFVYIWYDRKRKMYYVGCHWGPEDDSYICSSPWMKQAFKHRPQDFKRRIFSRIYTTKQDLFKEEFRFLNMINPEELGKRYYNLRNSIYLAVDKKIVPLNRKGRICSEETKLKMRKPKPPGFGEKISIARAKQVFTEETKLKMGKSRKGKRHTEETKQKIRIASKKHRHTEETKQKIRIARAKQVISKQTRAKISLTLTGRIGV